jgi:hypothetical protein
VPLTIMLVTAYPTSPEAEDEFNTWYSDVHMRDVLAVPGVVGFSRYRQAGGTGTPGSAGAAPYLSIVTIDSTDVEGTVRELQSRNGTDAMRGSPALGREPGKEPTTVLYELIE